MLLNINGINHSLIVFVFWFLHKLNTDIDECSIDNDCDVNADCTNNDGGYDCDCKDGYAGSGLICTGM